MSARAASKKSSRPSRSPKKTSPSEVAPGFYVGGWKDAVRFEGTKFCVLDEAPPDMPAATHVPIFDGEKDQPIRENLDRLAGLIGAARERKEPVLVFCGHGVRRSPLASAWYLHRAESIPLEEAYSRVEAARPGIERVQEWASGWRVLDAAEPSKAGSRR